jgi:hypothetical protein
MNVLILVDSGCAWIGFQDINQADPRSGSGSNELSGPKVVPWNGNALKPEKRQLVEIAALENDLAVLHVEEAAATQPGGIPPFQDRPLAILEDVLGNARHFRTAKLRAKHVPDGLAAKQGLHDYLMIRRIHGVERGKTLHIRFIEAGDPLLH